MRVRPFFWALLAMICVGVLLFAETISLHRYTPMSVHIDQVSAATFDATSIRLHLSDSEGLPIEQASVTSHASMPAMHMTSQKISIQALGQGIYLAHLHFSMTGAWNIEIIADAEGFTPVHQSFSLNLS